MSESAKRSSGTQLPDLPRDLPMPAYKYQKGERGPGQHGASIPLQDAAAILRGYDLMGCAAAGPMKP